MSRCKYNRHIWKYLEIKNKQKFAVRVCSNCGLIQQAALKWDKGFLPQDILLRAIGD